MNVTYILLRFPKLTETFVAEEIHALLAKDIDVHIVSLLKAESGPVQPLSRELADRAWSAPGLLSLRLWKAQFHYGLTRPWRTFRSLVTLLSQPAPGLPLWATFFKRAVVYLKAVAAAYELRDSGTRLLHTHFAWLSGAAAWIMARLLEIPFTVTVHAFDLYSSQNDLLPLVAREADHIIAISEFNRRHIEASGAAPPGKISVIHCGVDVEALDREPPRLKERSGSGPLRILSVGSLVPKKGHRVLIAACRRLERSGLDFECTIIGGGPDAPALRKQAGDDGRGHRIRLTGACSSPEIIEAYRRHDLFVLACQVAPDGDRDGIPVVLMEAGILGLPLLSTTVSGIPELVIHGRTGWLVPPGDDSALADAIALLASDPDLRKRLGDGAREHVRAWFAVERSAQQLASLFRGVTEEKAGRDRSGRNKRA